jgi:hypothetical protein
MENNESILTKMLLLACTSRHLITGSALSTTCPRIDILSNPLHNRASFHQATTWNYSSTPGCILILLV